MTVSALCTMNILSSSSTSRVIPSFIHLKERILLFLSFSFFCIVVGSSLRYSLLPVVPQREPLKKQAQIYFDCYRRQGRMAEAEAMCLQALRGYAKAWRPEHTSTLDTFYKLCYTCAIVQAPTHSRSEICSVCSFVRVFPISPSSHRSAFRHQKPALNHLPIFFTAGFGGKYCSAF